MSKSIKNKKTVENNQQKTSSKGLTAKQIVKRHMRNKNAVITEDDMKNVKIESSLPHDKAHEPLPIPADAERPKDADKDNKTETPWDIINE